MNLVKTTVVAVLIAQLGCGRFGFEIEDDAQPMVDGELSAISVSNLRATWTTTNWIRWDWDRAGVLADFQRYELAVATSMIDLENRNGSTRVFTPAERPQFAGFNLPTTSDPVVFAMTDGHDADADYYGQLQVVDVNNRTMVTLVVFARTQPATVSSMVIFRDADTAGYSIPATLVLSTRAPLAGTSHYEFTSTCGGLAACFENLRRQGLADDFGVISVAAFEQTAFIEFAVAAESGHSYWSQVRLMFGSSGNTETVAYSGWTHRSDDTYRRYQVPLRVFGGLTHAVISTRALYEFGVGGSWTEGARVRLDEIVVRW